MPRSSNQHVLHLGTGTMEANTLYSIRTPISTHDVQIVTSKYVSAPISMIARTLLDNPEVAHYLRYSSRTGMCRSIHLEIDNPRATHAKANSTPFLQWLKIVALLNHAVLIYIMSKKDADELDGCD